MNFLKYTILLCALLLMSCKENKTDSNNIVNGESNMNSDISNPKINIEDIKSKMCNEFPKELVLKYNTDATHITIEPISNGSGGILHCKVKLFYGKKDYEFWEGQVTAWVNQQKDPFWQYNPKRNAAIYHKVEGIGDKAVYIANTYQLLILKKGVMYSIAAPSRGRSTNTGKENKEIVIEIAKHYQI
ncbi:hypothetical protein [Polaribacter sp. Asnod1-A03]|uniref:hypothetical protein n=1 Tax=Polaribacter sp. Asnod1-A03 TaxID=3160581 RepID=UPI0038692E9B